MKPFRVIVTFYWGAPGLATVKYDALVVEATPVYIKLRYHSGPTNFTAETLIYLPYEPEGKFADEWIRLGVCKRLWRLGNSQEGHPGTGVMVCSLEEVKDGERT